METLQLVLQSAVAISVVYVWVFRYHNVLKEFEQFGLGDTTRNLVGATKISLATLLVVGIWYESLIFIPAILMGLFMVSAQYFHFKMKNPFIQKLPSLVLLIFCLALAYFNCPS
ncbi:MAG: hypothetical protein GY823_06900 [Flavobacteriaceae bacterium]|jgi:hypothetical protein|nr:hypothetical protein [Flavobacteriaceae bacterium]